MIIESTSSHHFNFFKTSDEDCPVKKGEKQIVKIINVFHIWKFRIKRIKHTILQILHTNQGIPGFKARGCPCSCFRNRPCPWSYSCSTCRFSSWFRTCCSCLQSWSSSSLKERSSPSSINTSSFIVGHGISLGDNFYLFFLPPSISRPLTRTLTLFQPTSIQLHPGSAWWVWVSKAHLTNIPKHGV